MAGKEATKPKTSVAIKDLPIYKDSKPPANYAFVEDEPIRLEQTVRFWRHTLTNDYLAMAEQFKPLGEVVRGAKSAVVQTNQYVREEWTALPKAAAITVGGMAGFVLGLRRYGIRKFVYAAGAVATMAAFCYPNEAIDFVKVGAAHAQRTWEDFQRAPEPKKTDDSKEKPVRRS